MVPAFSQGPLWLHKALYIMNKVYTDVSLNRFDIYRVNFNIYYSFCVVQF